jgi:BirA family biotin operon repressor/biotin-[acetyl-CoA-carboxylase] ligase
VAVTGPPRRSAAPTIVRREVVTSTQEVAFELAVAGAADGTAVVADFQTHGRGRRGRGWTAPAGRALTLSVIVWPRLAWPEVPLLSYAAARAVATTLERVAGVPARLKWPNDVLVRGRKIAGVLLEGRAAAHTAPLVVVGMGLNLAQRDFPGELAGRATSVALETGHAPDREETLRALLAELSDWRARLEAEGAAPIRAAWLARADTIGQRVRVDGVPGVAVDLDLDGALVLDEHGVRHRVVAGELVAPGPGGERTGGTGAISPPGAGSD